MGAPQASSKWGFGGTGRLADQMLSWQQGPLLSNRGWITLLPTNSFNFQGMVWGLEPLCPKGGPSSETPEGSVEDQQPLSQHLPGPTHHGLPEPIPWYSQAAMEGVGLKAEQELLLLEMVLPQAKREGSASRTECRRQQSVWSQDREWGKPPRESISDPHGSLVPILLLVCLHQWPHWVMIKGQLGQF